MLMLNKFMFEEKVNYTFAETFGSVIGQTGGASIPLDQSGFKEVLQVLGYLEYLQPTANSYGLSFVALIQEEPPLTNHVEPTDLSVVFMNKLYMRYKEHYAMQLDREYIAGSTELYSFAKEVIIKVINKLDYTYLKYSTLLNAYENQKAHLLDKLERTRSGERNIKQDGATSGTGARQGTSSESGSYLELHNDTPQTTDVVATMEGNQYVSDLKKGSSSASGTTGENSVESGETHSTGEDTFEENESWDSMTNMARLDEIEKQFSNLWMKWLNEFDELFIEEVNF